MKIGDKVIVLIDNSNASYLKRGDVVEVKEDGLGHDGDVVVLKPGDDHVQYITPQHVSLDLDYFKKAPAPADPGQGLKAPPHIKFDLCGDRIDDLGGLAEIGGPEDKYADQRKEQAAVGGGMRFNEGKPKLVYNDFGTEIAELEAAVWEVGARKYDTAQWLKGQSALEAYSSMKRHMLALLDPNRLNDLDDQPDPKGNPGSGLHHGGHLICAVKIFVHALIANEGKYDDRPVKRIPVQVPSDPHEETVEATPDGC